MKSRPRQRGQRIDHQQMLTETGMDEVALGRS
jgi:hypothetical protein